MITACTLCPNKCYTNRQSGEAGLCHAPDAPKLARAALHHWEEPVLSGVNGSGAVFFSGCTMQCVFCQNYRISEGGFGKEISVQQLADIFLSLQEAGAHNINLVSATPYVPHIIKALEMCKAKLHIPVIYNSGGYELPETIRSLNGYIDIYLPDLKYISRESAGKYSGRPEYFHYAEAALNEMLRQIGKYRIVNGLMQKGVIVRHLVLPSKKEESIRIIRYLQETYQKDDLMISLMRQYTPCHKANLYPEINRPLTTYEYQCVKKALENSGFDGFTQEKASAKAEYTPLFDLTGI